MTDNNAYPSIGGFYQCYKQPKAFLATLTHFRSVYPSETVVIVSDGGDDYSHAAQHFGCTYSSVPHEVPGAGTIFTNKDSLIRWFNRLLEAAHTIKEDYILLLEDDVRVIKPISNLAYDLNGINKKERLGKKLTSFLKTKNASIPDTTLNYFYGGCGGSIIKRKFLLEKIRMPEAISHAIDEIEKNTEAPHSHRFASDYYLTAVLLYYGGSIGNYPGFCEYWRNTYTIRKYFLKNIEVVHQDKTLYNKPLTNDEKEVLGYA